VLRTVVASSSILSIGHDARRGLLEIEFQNGRIYHYFDVPADVYRALMRAPSKGGYLNATIIPNYHCERAS
jgi:hypothetical protein